MEFEEYMVVLIIYWVVLVEFINISMKKFIFEKLKEMLDDDL